MHPFAACIAICLWTVDPYISVLVDFDPVFGMTRRTSPCQAQAASNEPTDERTDERADERAGRIFRVWGCSATNLG